MKFSLRYKILMLTAGAVMALALVILTILAVVAGRQIDSTERSDVRATRAIFSQVIALSAESLRKQGELLAAQPYLRESIGTNDPATVADIASDTKVKTACDGVVLTDRSGSVLGQTDRVGAAPDADLANGIKRAANGSEWSGVVTYGGHLALAVCVPVKIAGYVWGTCTLCDRIDDSMAQGLKRALGTDIAFVSNGRVLGATLKMPAKIPFSDTGAHTLSLGRTQYIELYGPLPGTLSSQRLGFVTLRPYNQVMGMYLGLRSAFVIVILVSLILSLGAGVMLSRSLTGPLDGLVDSARTLQNGQWPQPFASRRHDEIGLLQSVFDDMTASVKRQREQLEALIDTDPLTGIDNHRRFQERLVEEANESRVFGSALTLLMINIDGFKEFNQRNGLASGDDVLRAMPELLRDLHTGSMARYGGDLFTLLLPHIAVDDAGPVAERIRSKVESSRLGVTASIGYATFGAHSKEPEGLLLAVELATTRAKQLGRNQVCGFDSVPGADATADPSQLSRYLKDGSLATIQALAAAVDAKDSYTQGHSQSVARYAVMLARKLGMSEKEIDLIHTTGTLHDVGKIGVPDAILKKPGRLDDAEREIMETHPALGEVIVRKAPQLAATIPGVRHHHERWDGRGYPDKLSGERIPLIARMLALADSFDAMTSDRPYRKGLGWEVALAEIERGAGGQFDPRLAPIFVAMMEAEDRAALASLRESQPLADYPQAA